MAPHNIALSVDQLYKEFRLPHERKNTLKDWVLHFHKPSYENLQVLRDISFEINKGEFFGIVGRNGSGKSTLLKVIGGIYQPTRGSVKVHGTLTPFIELGIGFNPELTGRENVFLNGAILGLTRKEITGLYEEIVAFAELEKFMDQKLKNYSSGMQVRLAFSIAIRAHNDILLIDEVLAVGDANFQKKCFNFFKQLKKSGKTVIFVTHDMGAIQEFCDRALLIKNGQIQIIGKPREVSLRYQIENVEERSQESVNVGKGLRQRPYDPEVKIESITLTDLHNKVLPKNSVSLREAFVINIEYSSKAVRNIAIGINFTHIDGLYIAGYSTKEGIGVVKANKGLQKIVCQIEPGQLSRGDYFVNSAIFAYEDFSLIDFMDSSTGIKTPLLHVIESDRAKDGIFNIKATWKVGK
jgi:ABC-2 type transport system ATP-binding protein